MPTQAKAALSVSEILAAIRHSELFTVVIEGSSDAIVLRKLEEEFADEELDLVVANGRLAVLEIFRRRSELPANKKVIFVADKDLWVLSSIPAEYLCPQLLFTAGYSIENDAFDDGDLVQLLTREEKNTFSAELDKICKWFALVASRHMADPQAEDLFDVHPSQLLHSNESFARLTALKVDEVYPEGLRQKISAAYTLLLRGTNLFHLLIRCSRTHKYAYTSLLNIGAARKGPRFKALCEQVRSYLESHSTRPEQHRLS